MFLNMPSLAAANHKHEFSTVQESNMDQEHGFSYSLQYLQTRLQALTSFGNPLSPTPAANNTNTNTSAAVEASEVSEDQLPNIAEPENTPPTSEPAPPAQRKRRSTIPKTSTSFQLAHPPPTTKHKQRFKVRPKVLLQLRQISESRSPVPVLEVLPSVFCGSRLLRRFPRVINGRNGLGPDDLIVVNSQKYEASEKGDGKGDDISDDENNDSREVVAAICQPAKGESYDHARSEISFANGVSWTAFGLTNGGYQFTTIDEFGIETRARWVPKNGKHKRKGSYSPEPSIVNFSERKASERNFKFSILVPNARRHPVIASLDRHSIDIVDRYVMPSSPVLTPAPASPVCESATTGPSMHSYFQEPSSVPGTILDTDDDLRTLALVTGIWVAFVEGWSDVFKYEDEAGLSTSSANGNSPSKIPTLSRRRDNGNGNRAPTPQSNGSGKSRHSAFNLLHRPNNSAAHAPSTHSRISLPQRTQSAGAKSPGAAFVERARRNAAAAARTASPGISTEKVPTDTFSGRRRSRDNANTGTALQRLSFSSGSSQEERHTSSRDGAAASDGVASNRSASDNTPRLSLDSGLTGRIDPQSPEAPDRRTSRPKTKKTGKVNRLMSFIHRKAHREKRQ